MESPTLVNKNALSKQKTIFTLNAIVETNLKENTVKMIAVNMKNTLKRPTFLILHDTQIDHATNAKENIENMLPTNTELHKTRILQIHTDNINKFTNEKAKISLINTATMNVAPKANQQTIGHQTAHIVKTIIILSTMKLWY